MDITRLITSTCLSNSFATSCELGKASIENMPLESQKIGMQFKDREAVFSFI
jgi:hypothetical protein